MNVLSGKIVVQGSARAALAAIPAQTGKQRGFRLVKGGDQLAVCQRQIVKRRLAFFLNIRVEQPGFQFQIMG